MTDARVAWKSARDELATWPSRYRLVVAVAFCLLLGLLIAAGFFRWWVPVLTIGCVAAAGLLSRWVEGGPPARRG